MRFLVSTILIIATSCGDRPDGLSRENCEASGTLVHVKGANYHVVLHRGSDEQLYSVKDSAGRVLVTCCSHERLRNDHPDVYRSLSSFLRTLEAPDFGGPRSTPELVPWT